MIFRRVDASYADPLELRPDSQLGVPGLLEAARRGTVSIVNGIGSGIVENPGLLPFLPALCRALLDQPLLLPSVPTWWCGDPASRSHVLAHLDDLVVKPIDRGVGRAPPAAGSCSADAAPTCAARIEAEPHAWVGQQRLDPSTAPTVTRPGLEPRPLVLRSFTVAQGGAYRVLTGGLTRVGQAATGCWSRTSRGAWPRTSGSWTAPPGRSSRSGAPRAAAARRVLARDHAARRRRPVLARALRRAGRGHRAAAPGRPRAGRRPPHLTRGTEREAVQVLLQALTAVTAPGPGSPGRPASPARRTPQTELLSLTVDRERPGHRRLRGPPPDRCRRRRARAAVPRHLAGARWPGARAAPDLRPAAGRPPEQVLGAAERPRTRPGGAARAHRPDRREPGARRRLALHGRGRRLERAMHVVSLLRATVVQDRAAEVDTLVVESVLVATESIVTFRRRHPSRAGVAAPRPVLTDRENPRSVGYQVDRLGGSLVRLLADAERSRRCASVAGRSRPDPAGRRGLARRVRRGRASAPSSTPAGLAGRGACPALALESGALLRRRPRSALLAVRRR